MAPKDHYLFIIRRWVSLRWIHKLGNCFHSCALSVCQRHWTPSSSVTSCNSERYYLVKSEVKSCRVPEVRHRYNTSNDQLNNREVISTANGAPSSIRLLTFHQVLVNSFCVVEWRFPVYSDSACKCINGSSWFFNLVWHCACLNEYYTRERTITPVVLGSDPHLVSGASKYS